METWKISTPKFDLIVEVKGRIIVKAPHIRPSIVGFRISTYLDYLRKKYGKDNINCCVVTEWQNKNTY